MSVENWEKEHNNSVLETPVSFLGIRKWEPDIYTGFSLALHLQYRGSRQYVKYPQKICYL
jgi:hypothetical protein